MLMSDIIKIFLYRKEIDLACYLTSFYNMWIDKELICQAVEYRNLKWVKFLFAFGKNIISTTENVEEPEMITFKQLFGVIRKYYEIQME
jgi:hypothetical protein